MSDVPVAMRVGNEGAYRSLLGELRSFCPSVPPRGHVGTLPGELLVRIFEFLPREDQVRAASVCGCFWKVLHSDVLWKGRGPCLSKYTWEHLNSSSIDKKRSLAVVIQQGRPYLMMRGAGVGSLGGYVIKIMDITHKEARALFSPTVRALEIPLCLDPLVKKAGLVAAAPWSQTLLTAAFVEEEGAPYFKISKCERGPSGWTEVREINATPLLRQAEWLLDAHLLVRGEQPYLLLCLRDATGPVVRCCALDFEVELPVFKWEARGGVCVEVAHTLCRLRVVEVAGEAKIEREEIWDLEYGCLMGFFTPGPKLSQIQRWHDHCYVLTNEEAQGTCFGSRLAPPEKVWQQTFHPLQLVGSAESPTPGFMVAAKDECLLLLAVSGDLPTYAGSLPLGAKVWDLVVAPVNNRIYALTEEGRVLVVDLDEGRLVRRSDLERPEVCVSQFSASETGEVAFIGDHFDGVVKMVYYPTPRVMRDALLPTFHSRQAHFERAVVESTML